MTTPSGIAARRTAPWVPAPAYFGISAIFHYLGPAFTVLLFARVDVLGVAWLRIASAAMVATPFCVGAASSAFTSPAARWSEQVWASARRSSPT